jgi:hypothetical protein
MSLQEIFSLAMRNEGFRSQQARNIGETPGIYDCTAIVTREANKTGAHCDGKI